MKLLAALALLASIGIAGAAERSIDKSIVVPATLRHTGWGEGGEWDKTFAYFDRAWDSVLANLKKRFENGPQDWTEWMESLRKMQEQAAQKK